MWTLATLGVWSVKTVNEMIEGVESETTDNTTKDKCRHAVNRRFRRCQIDDGSQNGKETENEKDRIQHHPFWIIVLFWMLGVIALLSSERRGPVSWCTVESTGRNALGLIF